MSATVLGSTELQNVDGFDYQFVVGYNVSGDRTIAVRMRKHDDNNPLQYLVAIEMAVDYDNLYQDTSSGFFRGNQTPPPPSGG